MQQLRQRVDGKPVAVGFEAHRGALIYMLQQYDFLHLFPINPKSAARFREALYPSGSKTDPLDVDLILELLQKHRDHLVGLNPDTPETRLLGLLSEQRRQLVDQRTALVNELGARLKSYFPQAIELGGGDLTKPLAWDLLQRWSSLAAIKKAKPEVLRKFYYAHNSRSEERILARLELVRKAETLTSDPAVLEASSLHALSLVRQLAAVQKSVDEYEARLEQVLDAHPDAFVFRSLPGAGTVMASRLLAALGTNRERWEDAGELQVVSGVAPVIVSSGKSRLVINRWARPRFMHQSFVEFAKCSLTQCPWAHELYDAQKKRGKKKHWTALRTVAFRWMRIIYRCWKNRTAYDEQTYLTALRKHGSPYVPKPG
jgi:transposase